MSDPTAVPVVQRIVLEAALAALAVVVGFGLAAIPNVELFTFVVFISGVVLGWKSGMRVGFLAALVYGLLSPYGLPGPLVLLALVLSRMGIGAFGGILRPLLFRGPWLVRAALLAAAGAVATAFFHALTNLAVGLTIGQWEPVLIGAVPFAAWNLFFNVIEFVVLGVICVEVVRSLPIPGLAPAPRDRG